MYAVSLKYLLLRGELAETLSPLSNNLARETNSIFMRMGGWYGIGSSPRHDVLLCFLSRQYEIEGM
jgi:hypothetical protein